jgi:hypothetical protein
VGGTALFELGTGDEFAVHAVIPITVQITAMTNTG